MYTILKQQQKGFSLIEFLLYMSLSMVMLALLGGIGINVLQSKEKDKALEEIQYSVPYVMMILGTRIEQAEQVILPEVGEVSSTLSLQTRNPDTNPTTFDVFEGKVRMQEGEHEPVIISTSGILVENLAFVPIGESEVTGIQIQIKVSPRAREGQPESLTSFEFNSMTSIRK